MEPGQSSQQEVPKLPTEADFDIIRMLGKGAFAEVYLVRYKLSSELMAMKVINKSLLKKTNNEQRTTRVQPALQDSSR